MILIIEPRQQKQQQQQLQERRTKSAITKKWKETDNSRWWQDIQNSAESTAKPISFIWKTSFYGKVSEFTGSANYCKLSSLWSSQVREGLINVEIITANVLSCRPSGTPMSQHCPPSTNNIPFPLYRAPTPPLTAFRARAQEHGRRSVIAVLRQGARLHWRTFWLLPLGQWRLPLTAKHATSPNAFPWRLLAALAGLTVSPLARRPRWWRCFQLLWTP